MKKVVLAIFIFVVAVVAIMPNVFADFTSEMSPSFAIENLNRDVYDGKESLEKKNQIVNGNMYLFANSVYIENETVNGDVFIFANTVKIDEKTNINGNVFVVGMNVKVNATITRGIYVWAKDIIFDEYSFVQYDANIFAEHIIVNGTFDRGLNTGVDSLEIGETAIIKGDLNYISDKEAKISDNATVKNVNFDKHVVKIDSTLDIVCKYVLDFTKYFVLTFVIFIFMLKLVPNFINSCRKYVGVNSFGLGILSIILLPIVFVCMIWLKVTASLALLGVALFITILLLSIVITNISIASILSNKFEKIDLPVSVALVTVLSWIIYQIPFFGGIVGFFMITTGVGIVLKHWFLGKREV